MLFATKPTRSTPISQMKLPLRLVVLDSGHELELLLHLDEHEAFPPHRLGRSLEALPRCLVGDLLPLHLACKMASIRPHLVVEVQVVVEEVLEG